MKKLMIAAMMLMLLHAAAYSQVTVGNGGGEDKGPPTARTDKEKKSDEAIEKAYEQAVKRERELSPSAKSDPWGGIRSSGNDSAKH
jgi:hypothetical protein